MNFLTKISQIKNIVGFILILVGIVNIIIMTGICFNYNIGLILSSAISAIATIVLAYYAYQQYKKHYDSELDGFIKESKSKGGQFKLECTLVNSGGVPILIKNISYSLEDSKKSESLYYDKVDKFYIENQDKLNECKMPLSIKVKDTVILVLSFVHWDSNGHILILPDKNKRIDTIKIKFDYLVYKTFKKFLLSYNKQ